MGPIAAILGGLVAAVLVLLWMVLRSRHAVHTSAPEHQQQIGENAAAQKRADLLLTENAALRTSLTEAEGHWRGSDERHRQATGQLEAIRERFRPILDLEAECQRLLSDLSARREAVRQETQEVRGACDAQRRQVEAEVQIAREAAAQENADMRAEAQREIRDLTVIREQMLGQQRELETQLSALRRDVEAVDELATLQSFGFYHQQYNFGTSAQYEVLLQQVCSEQKAMIKAKGAALCHIEWLVNGSKREGQKQINQTLKLMLRAFNGETDAAIARVTYKNFAVMEKRIRRAYEMVNGLAEVQRCRIAPHYLELRLQELVLVHEHQEKLHAEREEQRRIRERMRDEEIAQRQMRKAQEEAEEDERQYEEALARAREEAEQAHGKKHYRLTTKVAELERRLAEAHENKERAVARAQLTRSGHVYVISNLGSFGENIYKIGLTRRLDPLERIRELGDASVPFEFDVHAVIFAEDAPALETQLHQAFADRRVNRVNERKEFFQVSIAEIAEVVRRHNASIMVTLAAEAEDYRKTRALQAELDSMTRSATNGVGLPSAAP